MESKKAAVIGDGDDKRLEKRTDTVAEPDEDKNEGEGGRANERKAQPALLSRRSRRFSLNVPRVPVTLAAIQRDNAQRSSPTGTDNGQPLNESGEKPREIDLQKATLKLRLQALHARTQVWNVDNPLFKAGKKGSSDPSVATVNQDAMLGHLKADEEERYFHQLFGATDVAIGIPTIRHPNSATGESGMEREVTQYEEEYEENVVYTARRASNKRKRASSRRASRGRPSRSSNSPNITADASSTSSSTTSSSKLASSPSASQTGLSQNESALRMSSSGLPANSSSNLASSKSRKSILATSVSQSGDKDVSEGQNTMPQNNVSEAESAASLTATGPQQGMEELRLESGVKQLEEAKAMRQASERPKLHRALSAPFFRSWLFGNIDIAHQVCPPMLSSAAAMCMYFQLAETRAREGRHVTKSGGWRERGGRRRPHLRCAARAPALALLPAPLPSSLTPFLPSPLPEHSR